MSYDVILMGFRLNNGEAPAKVLERVLGLDAAKAKLATQRFPVILARTSAEKAERIASVLREAGASVELRENRESGPRDVAPAAPPGPPPPPMAARPLPDLPPVPKLAPPPALGLSPPALDAGRAPSLSSAELAPAGARGSQAVLESTAGLPAPTPSPASVLSAQPANDQGSPTAGAGRATAYQLGDLDLGGGPPAAKPAPAPTSAVTAEEPALEVAIPVRAAAPAAPAPAPAASGMGGDGGMQSFGDGLDDMEGKVGPALELDTDAAWLKRQKPAPGPQKSAAAAEPSHENGVRPSPRPPKPQQPYVLPPPPPWPKRLLIALEDALIAARPVAINLLVFLLITLLSGGAVAFARNPDATFELVGLASPPPAATSLEIPVVSAGVVGDAEDDPRLHPLLRVAPPQLQPDVLTLLRKRVPGVYPVSVSWPKRSELTLHDLQCMLVEQASNDAKGRALITHVNALLRTGQALETPESVRAELGRAKVALRKQLGRPSARFVELCLAI